MTSSLRRYRQSVRVWARATVWTARQQRPSTIEAVSSSDGSDLYATRAPFELRRGHRLSWLRFLWYSCPSRQMQGCYLKLYYYYAQQPFKFITRDYSTRYDLSLLIKLTPWSWALLQKPLVAQPLKNLPAFQWTRRFIAVFTRALQWSLSWARSIQSTPPDLSKIQLNIILPPMFRPS
jgi:hypothetical protein